MSVKPRVVLSEQLANRPPGESVRVSKADLPSLPGGWSKTLLGTPLWIAKPGSTAQYRSGALHAYEFEDGFDIHRDRYDPSENPLLHAVFDATETFVAFIAAVASAVLTYFLVDRREKEKPEDERRWWLPLAAAIGVAALVGICVYVLGAMVRVGLGVG